MKIVRFFIAIITNFLLGIIAPALIITQLTGNQAIMTGDEIGINFSLDTFGILAWFVVVLLYFFGGKYFLGKSPGRKIADIITGNK